MSLLETIIHYIGGVSILFSTNIHAHIHILDFFSGNFGVCEGQ